MESKNTKRINFMKPPFKGVFKSVQSVLSDEYSRNITIEAISQAYNRCDPIVVELVKKEIENRIPGFDDSIQKKKRAKEKKEKFENLLASKYSVEA